ncbi:unnamed protein product [Polarella glacialis]|uniref:Uncharacterized protein n=1 Tax=Polarella glacialis TaxID=89957 RepID=A0A813KQ26_POLGL|nr:unnamed protein product [Polarella glacialis]
MAISRGMPPTSWSHASEPMATVGLDIDGDGIADIMVAGQDLDGDGIPDALQGHGVVHAKVLQSYPTQARAQSTVGRAIYPGHGMSAGAVGTSAVTRVASPPRRHDGYTQVQAGYTQPHAGYTQVQGPAVQMMYSAPAPVQMTYSAPAAMTIASPPVVMRSQSAYMQPVQPVFQDVIRPVIQEVVREVPVNQMELHTIFRESHEVELVEKRVDVPVIEVEERVEEVLKVLRHERIVEVPEIFREEILIQVARVEEREVIKNIELPIYEARERIVEVPIVLLQECLVEVPQVQCIELIREVPKQVTQTVQKYVDKPIVQVRERVVEVPFVTVKEQIVEVPVHEIVEIIRQVPRDELQQVTKEVEIPVIELRERIVEVPQAEVVENPVEVLDVEICEVIRQVPKYEIRYVDKEVIRHQVEYIEKLVEVPHIVYEERIIEVPQVERRELIRHVPVTVVQLVDKHVPKHSLRISERIVEIPTVLSQEKPVEVLEILHVEAITEVPRPTVNTIPVEIPIVVSVQAQERIEEVPYVLIQERPVEVPEVQFADAITQVAAPQVQYIDKAVPKVITEAVEVIQEMLQRPLIEEVAVAVPQIMTVEAAATAMLNQLALVPSILVFFRPCWWPALAVCWPLWHETHNHGGMWFHFGWDSMMDEIGFLSLLLSITLTLYDDVVDESKMLTYFDRCDGHESHRDQAEPHERGPVLQQSPEVAERMSSETLRERRRLSGGEHAEISQFQERVDVTHNGFWEQTMLESSLGPETTVIDWSRTLAELSLTLAGFRLFLAAGQLKMRVGSRCWKDLTCLYDHYETKPMPNAAAWYFHTCTSRGMKSAMQWFAIDLAECMVPFLLLGFAVSMGPVGLLHRKLLGGGNIHWLVRMSLQFPARLVGSFIIMVFVLGMFIGGNYAFLHSLSVVSLVASTGTVRGIPVEDVRTPGVFARATSWYRRIFAWLVIVLAGFVFLPSLGAYAWICTGNEATGSLLEPLMQSAVVQQASAMNLGIPYNRHAYFAGAVHERNEVVLLADVGQGWVEMDIPYKVGRPDRSPAASIVQMLKKDELIHPQQTSPLHRRFAWQWWFLGLGDDPTWLQLFLEKLCERHPDAWNAVERNPLHSVHDQLVNLRRVSVRMYNYRFAQPGETGLWWNRTFEDSPALKKDCEFARIDALSDPRSDNGRRIWVNLDNPCSSEEIPATLRFSARVHSLPFAGLEAHRPTGQKAGLSTTVQVLLFESDVDVQEKPCPSRSSFAESHCQSDSQTNAQDIYRGLAVTGFYALLASADPEPMTALSLQDVVAIRWHIPPAFQRLMLGIIVLDNPEQSLASYIEVGESVLSLTLVISFDSVLQDLESGVGPRQVEALQELASLGRRGGDKSVAAVCRGLEDSDDGVRRTAVNVLHAVAEKGDLFAISEVVGRLQHGTPAVRCAAAEALATVVEMGDAAAVAEVMKLVEHPEDGVRGTAIQALLSITERGDPNVTFALRAFLEHKDVSVRCAALEALALVVQQGDTACSASARALLDDPDQLVRCRAVHALAFASKTGDASAICAVQVCLTDPDELVRCAAVEALAFIAEKDDPTAIRLICKRLEDTHCHVRSLAVQALASLAARGNATAIGPVSALLRNTMANIRCASVEALACIAEWHSCNWCVILLSVC